MKNLLFLPVVAMLLLLTTSCEKVIYINKDQDTTKTYTVVISIDGVAQTRSLAADGKDMSDIWLFDYVDGDLQQQIHQEYDDEDFGEPTLDLSYGQHNLYIVASRGTNPVVSTANKTISWDRPLDTFWKAVTVNVSATSNGTSVTLNRMVTKLHLDFDDVVPEGSAKFVITPALWYYGLNYQTGAPAADQENKPITLTIPTSYIGTTNVATNNYGFSSTTEWFTDVTVQCLDGDENVIGEAELSSVPFLRNRITIFSGKLWGKDSGFTISLNADWIDPYEGTW